jgi:DNA-binding MurR/RpiR family transcriptional regulator
MVWDGGMAVDYIESKLKGTSLTKTEEKIAGYFLEHKNKICFKTATDLAIDIGVSDTSIIRFVRTLGFNGYADFQKKMKEAIVQQISESGSPLQRHKKAIERGYISNVAEELLMTTLENLNKTYDTINMDVIKEITEILIKSRNKYIVAFGGTSSVACFMVNKLSYFLPDCQGIIHADVTALEKIVDITDKDCIVLFTFPRYTEIALSLAEIARSKKAEVIVITDKITCPVSLYADIVLTAYVQSMGFCNSYVTPMWIADLIILSVSEKITGNEDRMEIIDKYLNKHKLY